MIATDAESPALFDRAVNVKNVIRRAAAHVDDKRAEIFLLLGEHDLGRSERGKNHVLHFQWQFFDASNGVLNPRPDTVNDMKIGFQFLPEHPDRIQNAILPIDVIMLDDRVQKRVLRWNTHFTCADLHVLDILLVDLVPVVR